MARAGVALTATRRRWLTGAVALAAAPARATAPPLTIVRTRPVQGGFALLRTAPRAAVSVDGEAVGQASVTGLVLIGFDRDAGPIATVAAGAGPARATTTLTLARGDFDVQRVNGLPPNTVSPTDPALLARIKREGALKAAAFEGGWTGEGFAVPFLAPVQARVSGRFGGQRLLNGQPARPHYGVDLACPRGTQVRAPAAGRVALAEPSLHYEGGLVLLDHGQGLVSAYLHLSALDVAAGQVVAAGQRLGAVGATGRATGPHLCWRLKWRGRNLDPMLMI